MLQGPATRRGDLLVSFEESAVWESLRNMRARPKSRILQGLLAGGIVALVAACGGAPPTATPLPPLPTETPLPAATPTSPAPAPTPRQPAATPTPNNESVIQYVTAYAYLDRGDYTEAERYFTTVIELEPDFARGWDGRGQARLFKGDYEEALLDFDKAILLKPTLPLAYSHRAYARLATADNSGARRDAERALSYDDRLVDPHIVLGRVLAQEGDLAGALERFDRAIALSPESGSAWLWRGRFFRDAVGDIEGALSDLDRAVELEPARAIMYLERAITLLQAEGPVEQIKKDLEEAVSLATEPRLPDILERAETLLEDVKQAEISGGSVTLPRP